MGTLKLMNVKYKRHLWDSIEYILQEGKTENGKYVFGNSGYTPQMIYNTFLATKSLYGKTEGRQAYHYILTFAEEDSVTPELAQEITEKFMSRLFPEDEYDWVGGVHTDTEHLHAHILFNSVNRNTGYKYRYEKGDWEKTIQKIVDDLCHELGLATIAYEYTPEGKATRKIVEPQAGNHEKHNPEIANKAELIRQDLDRCIQESDSYETFLELLKQDGYTIQRQGNSKKYGEYLTLKPYGIDKGLRTYRLGSEYTVKRMKERILEKNRSPQPINHTDIDIPENGREYKRIAHIASIPAITYRRYYVKCLYIARRWKNGKPFPGSYQYKQAIIQNQKMMEEYQLLKKAGLKSEDDMEAYENMLEEVLRKLYVERKQADPESEEFKLLEQQIKTCRFQKRVIGRLEKRVHSLPPSELEIKTKKRV